jgi:ABC-type Fe3+-siderophore transport system permease subunit
MVLFIILTLICGICFAAAVIFTVDSIREKGSRPSKIGLVGAASFPVLARMLICVPASRIPIATIWGAIILLGIIFLIPDKSNTRSLKRDGDPGLFLTGYVIRRIKRYA